ncbi:hypothetical protein NDU88_000879 [Pleurodeles waltl]|uniref:Uncharacterized protein n=1 Tax=Pleurodeles waltl TaxID=8319 RepID=A0AAV7MI40_PLEWA|nr:hypothetical protein NDU88_000879 [Pleurodeles waltl]
MLLLSEGKTAPEVRRQAPQKRSTPPLATPRRREEASNVALSWFRCLQYLILLQEKGINLQIFYVMWVTKGALTTLRELPPEGLAHVLLAPAELVSAGPAEVILFGTEDAKVLFPSAVLKKQHG